MHLRTLMLLFFPLLLAVPTLHAQPPTALACGENLTNRFAPDQVEHVYPIEVESGVNLILHADPLPLSSGGTLTIEVFLPNGFAIEALPYAPEAPAATFETGELTTSGVYDVIVYGEGVSDYQLFVSCVQDDGTVITNNNLTQGIVCGEQVDNPVTRLDELQRYYIALNAGDSMRVTSESLQGDFGDLRLEAGLYSPNNAELDRVSIDFKSAIRTIDTGPVPTTGVYRLYVRTYDSSAGDVRMAIDCALADGSVVQSTYDPQRPPLDATLLTPADPPVVDAPPAPLDPPPLDPPPANALTPDLTRTVSVPLATGIANTGVITPEFEGLFTFTFEAQALELVELNVERSTGNLNVGVVVVDSDNTVIYLAHLITGRTLATQIEVPAAGEYAIGFYPLPIPPPAPPQATVITVLQESR